MKTEDIITFSCEFLPVITGMTLLSSLSKPYRILLCQCILVCGNDLFGYYLRESSLQDSNHWLYNFYQLADCGLLLLTAYHIDQNRTFRAFAASGFVIFLFLWSYTVYQNGIEDFAVNAYNFTSLLLIATYFRIFYYTAMNNNRPILRLPELWLCLGIILFYGCNIFFVSIMGDLKKEMPAAELDIITYWITVMLSNIRYLFAALSFYLVYRNKRSSIAKPYAIK